MLKYCFFEGFFCSCDSFLWSLGLYKVFGVIAVLIAAYIVKSLPLDILKWLVIVVIIYTSAMMFKSYAKPVQAKA
jgi:uncharacterized membrane protein YfcA